MVSTVAAVSSLVYLSLLLSLGYPCLPQASTAFPAVTQFGRDLGEGERELKPYSPLATIAA